MFVITDLHRLNNENEEQFIFRIGQMKDSGKLDMDWNDIAAIINKEFRDDESEYRTEAAYRKPYQQAKRFYEANVFKKYTDEDSYFQELRIQKQDIRKEKQKLFDERRDLNKRLRDTARLETTIENLENIISEISDKRYLYYNPIYNSSSNDMVVNLSDLHIGATYFSFDGVYDSDIAKKRLQKYLNEIIEIQRLHTAENCHVVLLGDLISGNIHHTISVTNRENVIEQVKLACELISDFIYELGKHFDTVTLHAVSGNHSRIQEKEDALITERLDVLIPWFCKLLLKNCSNIFVVDEEIDDTLSVFIIRDKVYFAVHGDFDSINDSSIAKLSLWAKITPYCVLCGHKHHSSFTEISGIKVVQSGCLGGSGDQYTREKRLTGKPSQTVLVVNKNGIKAYYPIELE